MIIGLDISTSITGYTILGDNGEVIEVNYWILKNFEDLIEKICFVKTKLIEIQKKHTITHAFIEQSLNSFSSGLSSANTILMLAKFNGTLSYLIYEIFGIKPSYIPATSARKLCGIKIIKSGVKAKQQVMEHALINFKWFKPEYKKTKNIKDHCYDIVDSYVIARAGFLTIKPV